MPGNPSTAVAPPFRSYGVHTSMTSIGFNSSSSFFRRMRYEHAEITNEFAEITNEFAEITNEFAEITNEFAEITNEFAEIT
ncbi:MAG: hypothetical protein V7K17_13010, partial [Nostoc sp.]